MLNSQDDPGNSLGRRARHALGGRALSPPNFWHGRSLTTPTLMALTTRSLRPTTRQACLLQRLSSQNCRSYYSADHPEPGPYSAAESAILSSALAHVPTHGFTTTSLKFGARDAGYLDASTNLFPRGVFDLVNYHCVVRRLALKDEVQFAAQGENGKKIGVGAKVRTLALARLRANKEVIGKWQEVGCDKGNRCRTCC